MASTIFLFERPARLNKKGRAAVAKLLQRGVRNLGHPPDSNLIDRICWDDLKILLACENCGSFRDAARELNMSGSTVSRRMDRLEFALCASLFDRDPDGVTLTQKGKQIAQQARLMHRTLCDLERQQAADEAMQRGTATIAVTEGLGSYWVMPRLVEFQREHPLTTINLFCAMDSVDVLRLEADISIQFTKPTSPDLIVSKLGRLHIYPFASQSYLDTYGVPTSVEDMVHHKLVEQVAPQIDNSALARYLGLSSVKDLVAIRTNNSTAHLYAIEKGGGIGGLPTFAWALGAPIVPVELRGGYSIDIWMTYHPDIRKSAHKSRAINWLKEIFDPSVYPWFREALIHPYDLKEAFPSDAVLNEGRGFFAVDPVEHSKLLRRRI